MVTSASGAMERKPTMQWLDTAAAENQPAVKAGQAAAAAVFSRLQAALLAEIARSGPSGAVGLCRAEALRLTAEAGEGAGGRVLEVKRTSLRVRNPKNRPDAPEQAALEAVAERLARGEAPPAHLLQRVDRGEGQVEVRFYRPVATAPLCVQCHGPRDGLDAGLARVLAEAYPEDAAVGYQAGDWRGLVRVSLREASDDAAKAAPGDRSR